jgi:uncharacterized protein (TIRG00374 family)
MPLLLSWIKHHSETLRFFFGLILFIALFCFLDLEGLGKILLQTHTLLYLTAYVLYAGFIWIRAFRWQCLLKDLGLPFPLGNLIRIHLVGFYLNLFVPGSLGGDIYKIYDVKITQSKSLRPLFALLVERLLGIASLAGISFFSSYFFMNQLPISPYLLMTVSGSIFALSLLSLVLLPHTKKILTAFSGCFSSRWKIPWEKLSSLNALSFELRHKYSLYVRTFFLSLILQMFVLMIYYTIAHAVNVRISLWQVLIFFPLIDLTSMIPISVNGIGVKEALLVYFLKQNGIAPSFSMSLAILCRLMETLFALLGGLLFTFKKKS